MPFQVDTEGVTGFVEEGERGYVIVMRVYYWDCDFLLNLKSE